MNMKRIQKITLFGTIVLGINLMFPLFVMARGGAGGPGPLPIGGVSSIGQGEETIQPGILQLTSVPVNFNFPSVNITDFLTYNTQYNNQQTGSEKLTAEDKRFSGGFEVQMTATEYVGQNNPANKIPVTSLGALTQVPNTNSTKSYSQTTKLTNAYLDTEGTLITNSDQYGAMVTQTLPFSPPMFGHASNQIYICTSGFIIHGADLLGLAPSAFSGLCNGSANKLPAGNYGYLLPYMTGGTLSTEITPGFDANNGVYYQEISANEVHIRYKGNIRDSGGLPVASVEFSIFLFQDGRVEYHYGPNTDGISRLEIGMGDNLSGINIQANQSPFSPTMLGTDIANQQIRFTPSPYAQTTLLQNTYSGTEGTFITNSNQFGTMLSKSLPFNFPMFGRESNQLYICSSGFMIHGAELVGISASAFNSFCHATGSPPAGNYNMILPYMDPNGKFTTQIGPGLGFNPDNGVYYQNVSDTEAHIRFKGNILNNFNLPQASVEFTVFLFKDGRVEYHYGPNDDSFTTPIIGIGDFATENIIYATEGSFGNSTFVGMDISNAQLRFSPVNTVFSDISKPGTPPVYSPTNSNSTDNPLNFTMFTEDPENPGFSIPMVAVEAAACNTQGRLGNYSVFPSFILQIPPTTIADTYQNTITFTIIDKTFASGTSFCPVL